MIIMMITVCGDEEDGDQIDNGDDESDKASTISWTIVKGVRLHAKSF